MRRRYLLADQLVLIAILAASLYGWTRVVAPAIRSNGLHQPLLKPTPRNRPFWSFADVIVWLGLWILTFSILSMAAAQFGWIEQAPPEVEVAEAASSDQPSVPFKDEDLVETAEQASISVAAILVFSSSTLLASLITLALLHVKSRHAARHLGLIPRRRDARVGLFASLLIIPPVLCIMLGVTQAFETEYRHEVLEALKADPHLGTIAALVFSAVIAAPITEEFAFRVLLQGSLQRLGRWRQPLKENEFVRSMEGLETPQVPTSFWPIVVSSIVFAGVHWDQFPAPIPLFFLAIGLGYLYRQTGSIFPSLIVHVMLNGLTMAVAIAEILLGRS